MAARSAPKPGPMVLAAAVLILLAGCGSTVTTPSGTVDAEQVIRSADADAVRAGIDLLLPKASGTAVHQESGVTVDSSNLADGYLMARSVTTGQKRKLRLGKDGQTYTYDLPGDGAYTAYPLSEGSGSYTLAVYEQVQGTSYALLFSMTLDATLAYELSPFLYPNALVWYDADTRAVLWSETVCVYAGADSDEEKSAVLYRYVADNIAYDYDKARAAADGSLAGYLPDVDQTLEAQSGICFDYASLLACMLRTQRIPTKLVTGYLGPDDEYHAWNAVYLDGDWVLMDATMDRDARQESAYTQDKQY